MRPPIRRSSSSSVDIQDEFACYGYRRVTRELRRRGHVVNHKRVARVMRGHGLGIKPRRRFVRTTDSDHDLPIFPNLYRNVIPAKPDHRLGWRHHVHSDRSRVLLPGSDPRCLQPQGRGLCDLAANRHATDARRVARAPWPADAATDTCIHHTDRGSQYASDGYRQALSKYRLIGSMSSRRNPYHNAQAESFMKTLKVEEVYLGGLRDLQ